MRQFVFRIIALAFLCCTGLEAQTSRISDQTQQYYREGERAIAANRLADASQAYEKLVRLDPTIAEAHAKLGLIYYMQGRFKDAVPELRSALQIKPLLANVDVLLAICYAELTSYEQALPGLERGFANPPDAKLRRLIGLELLRANVGLKHLDKAAQVAIELSQLYPDDPEVLYNTGHVLGDLAYASMKRLTVVAPNSVWVRQAVGETLEAQGQYQLAITEYRRAIEIDPNHPGLHFRLGRALLLLPGGESSEEALSEFLKECTLHADKSAAYEAGEFYRRHGQIEQSLKYFSVSVEGQPDFEEGQIGLARVLLQLKQPAAALQHLQHALKLNAENEVTHYQLAMVYRALGDTSAQQAELEQFQRLHQINKERRAMLAQGPSTDLTQQKLDPNEH